MTEVRPLVPGDLPALTEALDRHGSGGIDGGDGMRMSRVQRALENATAAVAHDDGRIVGYVANVHDSGDSFERIECAGEVLAPWRGRGIGGRLIDWSVEHAALRSRSSMLEVVVDCLGEDEGLRSLLRTRGFVATRFTQATARAVRRRVTPDPSVELRVMRPDDTVRVADLYHRVSVTEPLAGTRDAAVVAVLRHPYLRRDHCLLAAEPDDGPALGLALPMVWPDAADDLWIETLYMDPNAAHPGLLRAMVAELMRRGADEFATVSMGATDTVLADLIDLGFTGHTAWTRNALLVMAGTGAR